MRRIAVIFGAVLVAARAGGAGELPRVAPGKVGLSAGKMAEVGPALRGLVVSGKVPGGVAVVVRRGGVAEVVAFGWRDRESGAAMTEDAIFAIASMTKPVTCVAAMTLVESGRLRLEDPVGDYLPELKSLRVLGDARYDVGDEPATVPLARPLTIRDLLTHSSGISYGVFASTDARLKLAYERAGVIGPRHATTAELVARLGRVPLAHQPGAGWTYGFSHDVLGRVVEVVSGRDLEAYFRERIIGPLDMRDTTFLVPDSERGRVATIYDAGEAGGPLAAMPTEYGSATYHGGGRGLFSTARDYARFAEMLRKGGELGGIRVLKPETVAAMTANQIGGLESAPGRKYGLGLGLAMAAGGEPALERFYGGGTYSTGFWVVPRQDLVLVLMTQVTPTSHGGADAVFYRAVQAAIER